MAEAAKRSVSTTSDAAKESKRQAQSKALQDAVARAKSQVTVARNLARRQRTGRLRQWLAASPLGQRVPEKDLILFTRQFATMIDSGLPLVQCLEVQCAQAAHPFFRQQLLSVKRRVEGGSTLTTALEKHPATFDSMYVSLVAAGEAGGMLDSSLNRLAGYIENASKLKKQAKGALVYPATIGVVAMVVVAVLVLKVVPVFERMFGEFGEGLPAETMAVIAVSDFLRSQILTLILLIIGLVLSITYIYRTARGRLLIDAFLMRLPMFGDMFTKVAVARFCRTLGTMLASGVPILAALDICARTSGNKVVEASVLRAKKGIAAGRTIAGPLMAAGVFPPMVCQMLAVGETTGQLEKMVVKVADFYDEEVEASVAAITALIEPVLMVFLGVVIGGLLMAMYLPIFTMASAVGGG